MFRAEKITSMDVLFHHDILGMSIITVVACILFFSQNWGFGGVYILLIPVCLGFFAFYFKIAEIMHPNTVIPQIPLYQHPFGDESYLHSVFFTGYVVVFILIITEGYESIIYSALFLTLFKIFTFLIVLTFISCFHVAINKAWLTARIELYVKQDTTPSATYLNDEDMGIVPFLPTTKHYTIWSAAQQKFERLTLLNILIYLFLLIINVIDWISQTRIDLLPISLPGAGQIVFKLSLADLVSFIFSPVFFIILIKTLYDDIYNFDVEKIASVLVKIEPDNATREHIIKFFEKIQEMRKVRF
ncbi:MAG TPA: hypothetical protein VKM55_21075 [Candidatus Lokiarchaeia archaeon]|nr:hypothetical protein [Candidatus Lokiarchaeia archaeon]